MASQPGRRQELSDQTRNGLIEAGLSLFGEKGFDATSTRDIAKAAKTNIASISYHFGGKEGLRTACAERIVETFSNFAGAAALQFDPGNDTQKALAFLENFVTGMIRFITIDPRAQHFVGFILREISHPGPVIDIVYGQMFEPVHRAICRIWAVATGGDPDSDETKIAVFATIGQAVYFRIGRPIVMRRMEWRNMTPDHVEKITHVIVTNLRLAVQAGREQNQ